MSYSVQLIFENGQEKFLHISDQIGRQFIEDVGRQGSSAVVRIKAANGEFLQVNLGKAIVINVQKNE